MLATYRKLWAIFDRAGRLRLLALLTLMSLAAAIEGIAVAAVVPFLFGLKSPGSLASTFSADGSVSGYMAISMLAALFALAVLTAIALKALADYATVAFSAAQCARWSRSLLLTHFNRDYDWFLGQHSAELGYGLLARVQDVVTDSLLPALRLLVNALVAVCIVGVLVRSIPPMTFVIAALLIALYSAMFAAMRRRFVALGKEKETVGALRYRLAADVFSGIKEIKLHGLESGYDERIWPPFLRYGKLQARRHLYSILPRYLLEAMGFVTMCVVVLVIGSQPEGLQNVIPLLGLFGFAAFRLLPAIQQIYQNAVPLPMGLPGLTVLHRELVEGDDRTPEAPAPMRMACMIGMSDVRYAYPGSDRDAIDHVSLTLEAGSMVALVGRSGSGKSTIADFSMGLLAPASGSLLVDGQALDRERRRTWQAACSYVAQQVFLLDDSIAANIAFGLPEQARDPRKIEEAARAAALHDFVLSLPGAYATRVGERGLRLSGGQRQRIGIARALYRDASYLVLDEATNALDPGTEAEVLAALENIRGSRTILVIAHRLSTVEYCDRVLLIDDGRIVADGRYQDLLRGSAEFRRFANSGEIEHAPLRVSH